MATALRIFLALVLVSTSAVRAGVLTREVQRVCEQPPDEVLRGRGLAQSLTCATESPEDEDDHKWSFDLTGYWTDPPDDDAYGSAILRADRGRLHLEGRYNYEDIDTGSVWVGWTFRWSGAVEVSLVPMVGVVFGHTRGIAPGLEFDIAWKSLELYIEAEYVFDEDGNDDSFFYSWSELTVSPTGWLRVGLVTQRTRAYQTDAEVDWGPLVGIAVGSVSATVYMFNLDDDPYVMIGVGVSF